MKKKITITKVSKKKKKKKNNNMATASIYPNMDWSSTDLCEALTLFKQKMQLYIEDEEIKDPAAQARKICRGLGDEGLKRLNASGLSDAQKKVPNDIWTFLENQLKVNVNFRIHRLQLMQYRQTSSETLDDFVTRARTLALKCEFSEQELNERMIELIIVSTPHDSFRKELLGKARGTSINDVLTEGRKHEALAAGNQQLSHLTPSQPVDYFRKKRWGKANPKEKKCGRCDKSHNKGKCPAYDHICERCSRRGHFSSVCKTVLDSQRANSRDAPKNQSQQRTGHRHQRSNQNKHRRPAQVDAIHGDLLDSDNELCFDEITEVNLDSVSNVRDEVFTILKCQPPKLPPGKYSLKLKVDTGASGSTLPLRTFKQMYGHSDNHKLGVLEKCENVSLVAYNGEQIKTVGKITMPISVKGDKWQNVKFYVVDVPGPAIIGLRDSENLGLVTIHVDICHEKVNTKVKSDEKASNKRAQCNTQSVKSVPNNIKYAEIPCISNVDDLHKLYPDQFDKIGNFPSEAKLHLKENAEPYVAAPRKCSIHMRDKIKTELDRMEDIGVIRKVTEHTDWCSNVVFTEKKDGSLRVCLDPKKLNHNLKRCPHKIPTLEELNPEFSNAKVFSKLDAKNGYWSIRLDAESQLLTTFRSPLGQRYLFQRLPFGLNVSQDEFQNQMDEILENLPGVVSIADDVCVYGKDENEHDMHLLGLMNRAKEKGLVFNKSKCQIKQNSISFFGNKYTDQGVKPDPAKIQDVQNMPIPKDKDELKSFLGLMTYMAQFIPNFAHKAHILRELAKDNSVWCWDEIHQKCFDDLKACITEQSYLEYYNPELEVTLEVDASIKGLGACLTQRGKVVAYASKTLTDTETRYSNIEREMLAVVFGIQRFHTYVFGRDFTVASDHKPLSTITAKPINTAPARLQRMLLQITGYNYKVIYKPGSEMKLADALSRLSNPENPTEVPLEACINAVTIENISLINFSDSKKAQLKADTSRDPILSQLREYIFQGFPEKVSDLPTEIRPYFAFRDELAIESGVIFKGKQVLIPETMQNEILKQLHVAHQGIEKTRKLARESVYWLNISKHIETMCKTCETCQKYQNANQKEPLIAHEVPSKKWQFIATDLFYLKGKCYLIIVDRYSKYPLVDEISEPVTSKKVTDKIKFYCSLFGKPTEIMSDGGSHYTGQIFQKFVENWSIRHVVSSPRYPTSNGFIEKYCGYVKNTIKKALETGHDIDEALLNIRATPIDTKLPSPAELLLGTPLVTLLPSRGELGAETDREQLQKRKENMVKNDQKQTRVELSQLSPGQNIRILQHETGKWLPAIVAKQCKEPRSYIVETPNGQILRRNRAHIRTVKTPENCSFQSASERKDNAPQENNPINTQARNQSAYKNKLRRVINPPARFGLVLSH